MDHDERQAILRKHATMLREHFDSVQIFAERQDGDESVSHEQGSGLWHSRVGMVHAWVIRQDEEERLGCRRRDTKDNEDQDDKTCQ